MDQVESEPVSPAQEEPTQLMESKSSSNEEQGSEAASPVEVSAKTRRVYEDSFDYPDDEAARDKIISAALQKEDEFLEYLMSLPAGAKDKSAKPAQQPPLVRSTSEKAGTKVGLDHLDNLCKLMEQLGDLRERNSKLQRRVQYLEDLKNLQEMHKQLQQETMKRQLQEAALLQSIQMRRQATYTPDGGHRRSKKHCRHRQSLQPASQHRERSQSVGLDELNDYHESYDHTNSSKQTKRRQRRSLAAFGNGNKAKVSKWTKVKEAFRWEKASVVTLPETKSQDSGLGGITHHCCDEGGRYLRVPVGENMLSGSPSADSVISGHSICSSGAPSPGGEFALPTVSAMSSSSSSEELDIDLNYSDILSEFVVGPRRSASASDSTAIRGMVQEPRRLSLTCTPEEEEASRRSKSLDGDAVVGPNHSTRQHFVNKEGVKSPAQTKHHKTPWGKVKDIIQTRKDSLKKRQHRVTHKGAADGTTSSDHEDEATPETIPGDAEITSSTADDVTDIGAKTAARPRIEITAEPPTSLRRHKMSTSSLGAYPDATPSRRLTPMLTITLPSTEELRQINPVPALASPKHHHTTSSPPKCSSKPPPSPQTEERQSKSPSSPLQADEGKGDYFKHHHPTLFGPTSGSVGTSPPVHRRTSKWTKVKKAFLTSPGRRDEETSGRPTTSGPSSPNRISTFFYETDPDELSSGELGEAMGEEDDAHRESTSEPTSLQAEIQRNYEELQTKLSQEFHKKLHEWERMKASSSATSPCTGRASTSAATGGEDNYPHDKSFRRKMEEWEKIKQKEGTSNGKRESMALQPLDEDQLSPHFRKKLHEWQRIKKTNLPREDNSQSRKKIVEWQLWRTGSGKQGTEDQDDFHRKLQEWERIKSTSPCDSPTTKEAGVVECDRTSTGAKTPSPGVVRKDSTGEKKKAHGGVSGGGGGGPGAKSGHKAKTQKEKELHWLEKELQKIEREKQRLEREREKYLDREQRLEKMRRAVGSGAGKQEVLIQTSTGFFRFQGISEKFTRRLYEWEKARGIAPEASTFALLDPGYRPSRDERPGGADAADNVMLMRSKSAGSVTKLSNPGQAGATISHQPSSLSLNDVEALEQAEQDLADSRATSDPQLHGDEEDDEPAAVIVDVEDVVEETAAPLLATPVVEGQTPVYCYAPEEVTRLIDSSGSESDRDGAATVRRTDSLRTNGSENEPMIGAASVRRTDSVRTESSYKLLEENMTLLTKLKIKGDICRKLENELEDLEEKIDHVTKTHEVELERLRQEETDLQELSPERVIITEDDLPQTGTIVSQGESTLGDQGALVGQLRAKITELERRQERLRREGVTLQDSFAQHSEQQAALAQNLVGKMKQLREVNSNMASCDLDEPCTDSYVTSRQEDAMSVVQSLSTQLLTLAEKLEEALGERNREIHKLRSELEERRGSEGGREANKEGPMVRRISENDVSLGTGLISACDVSTNARRLGPYIPRQSSVELTQLPSLLTHKVLELKEGLNYLCATTDPNPDADARDTTATFVLKVKPKKPRQDAKVKTSEVVQMTSHGDGGGSPVTSVTITPGFWKRRGTEGDAIPPPRERFSSMDDQYGKTCPSSSHESFCSARSSSETSSAFGDEVKTVSPKLRGDNNNTIHVNLKDEAGGKTKPGAKVMRDATSRKHGNGMPVDASRKERVENGNFNLEGGIATDGRQKRPFKTRRASDTYDAYKRNENRNGVLQNRALRNSDGDPKDVGSRSRGNENEEETNFTFKLAKETTEGSDNAEARSNNSIVRTASQVLRRNNVATSTPVNVFVQTTRKIFAPVRRDSKGKASSVISYVVEEPEPPENTPRSPTAETSTARAASLVPTPQWMIMRSRSQSASPALPRRKVLGENSPEYNYPRGLKISPEKCRKDETTASEESSSSTSKETVQDGDVKPPESNAQAVARRRTVSAEEQKEPPVDTDKKDVVISAPRPTTPMGFPPLPPSPSPSRRDLFKHVAKDTAPSIRMMIAKYNQKLTEQDGAKSPEIGRSGSGSPVAWRSPVAERRVRTQMAKYQEEVQRVLMQGSKRIGRMGGSEVQKSASAGVIRSPEVTVNQPRASTSQGDCSVTDGAPRSVGVQRRGILKSSSAGSIKPATSVPFTTPPTNEEPVAIRQIIPISESLPDTTPSASECNSANIASFKKPVGAVSPILSRSPTPNSMSPSSEVGSPPLSRLRALRLQRAKEEFLTRGPGGKSWISDGGTPLLVPTPTPSTSTSPEPVWIRDIERFTGEESGNRLSQISVGSESSYDGSLVVPSTHACTPNEAIDDDGLLVKSASAGMINVDPHTYKKFSLERVNECTGSKKEKTKDHAKFGISSITSKFRKVKMRKTKEKGDNNKMNTVSLLCRQSLLVDINKKETNKNGEGPSSSVSCPSSPVLQRGSTEGKDDDDPSPGASSWIRNPAKLIFRPK